MSQEKVDRYKKEKANRKQTMKKEKVFNVLRKVVVGIAAILLVSWIGYSAYGTYQANQPKPEAEIDYSSVDEFMTDISNRSE